MGIAFDKRVINPFQRNGDATMKKSVYRPSTQPTTCDCGRTKRSRMFFPCLSVLFGRYAKTGSTCTGPSSSSTRIHTRAGRPNRRALIQRQEAFWEAEQAEAKFNESLDELGELGVFCLDPVAGQALIPFLNEDSLAWYVFDLFSPTGKRRRLHGDPRKRVGLSREFWLRRCPFRNEPMLRITTHADANSRKFQLEGQLAGLWVDELKSCSEICPPRPAVASFSSI